MHSIGMFDRAGPLDLEGFEQRSVDHPFKAISGSAESFRHVRAM